MSDFTSMTLTEAAELIAGKNAMILCHVNPDGDALGSSTALAEVIRLTGGSARVVTPSPVPERLRFIIGDADTAYTPGMESDFDTVLSADTASPGQLGDLSFLAEKVALSFDHHESCTLYSPHILYPGAAAAGLVIFDLLCELESMGRITGDTASALRRIYAAIASDTGSFKFANTSPEAFAAAAEISRRLQNAPVSGDCPIDSMSTSDISDALFDGVSRKEVAVRRLAYDNLRYICGGRIALSTVNTAELASKGLTVDDCGSMVDNVRSIEGTVAGIVLKQSGAGMYRGSARSNCDFDVAEAAAVMGGGGHKRAAGFKLSADSMTAAIAEVERVFGEALTRWREE